MSWTGRLASPTWLPAKDEAVEGRAVVVGMEVGY